MSELKRHHINEVMDVHNLTRGKTYIPTWNIKNGDFSEISPFLFLV